MEHEKDINFLFGNLGLLLSAILMSVASWFLVPVTSGILQNGQTLSKVFGIILGIFVAGFYLSAVFSSGELIKRGIKDKKWFWIVPGALVLVFDIVIIVINLI